MISTTATYSGIDPWSRDNGLFGNVLNLGQDMPVEHRSTPVKESDLRALRCSNDPFAGIGVEDSIKPFDLYGYQNPLTCAEGVFQTSTSTSSLSSPINPLSQKKVVLLQDRNFKKDLEKLDDDKSLQSKCSLSKNHINKNLGPKKGVWKKHSMAESLSTGTVACEKGGSPYSKKKMSKCGACGYIKNCKYRAVDTGVRICVKCREDAIERIKCASCGKMGLCFYEIDGKKENCRSCYMIEFRIKCAICDVRKICRFEDPDTKEQICKKCFQKCFSSISR